MIISAARAFVFIYSSFLIVLDSIDREGLKLKWNTNAGIASVLVRLSEETSSHRHRVESLHSDGKALEKKAAFPYITWGLL